MPAKFTESVVEEATLEWLHALGYDVLSGPDIAHARELLARLIDLRRPPKTISSSSSRAPSPVPSTLDGSRGARRIPAPAPATTVGWARPRPLGPAPARRLAVPRGLRRQRVRSTTTSSSLPLSSRSRVVVGASGSGSQRFEGSESLLHPRFELATGHVEPRVEVVRAFDAYLRKPLDTHLLVTLFEQLAAISRQERRRAHVAR